MVTLPSGRWSKEDLSGLDHDAFADRLAIYLERDRAKKCWNNIAMPVKHSNGYVEATGKERPDIIAVNRTLNIYGLEPHIYEIKVSRSDFLQDVRTEKYKKYLGYAHKFYYAVPYGLVEKEEVPKELGLIVCQRGTHYDYPVWYRWKIIKNCKDLGGSLEPHHILKLAIS